MTYRAYTRLEKDFEFLMIWQWVEFPGCWWSFGIHDDLSMSVICADVLCVSGRAAAELQPLWFLTCLSRAYCTWCYLFKAICTENNLPPPPPTSSSFRHLKLMNQPPEVNQSNVAMTPWTSHRNMPYMEFPPCHIRDFHSRHKGSFLLV